MRIAPPVLLAAAFLLGMAASGLAWWAQPYPGGDASFATMAPGLGVVALLAALVVLGGVATPRRGFAVMLGCFPAAVMLRVVADGAADPTSHNLWPFEILVAAALSLPAVAAGIGLGLLLRRVATRR